MMAVTLSLMAAAGMASMCYYTMRSFASMSNSSDMAMLSRMALDRMSRDIHANCRVTAFATNNITLQDSAGNTTQFAWDPTSRNMVCVKAGRTNIYLMQCDSLQFWIFDHTTQSNFLNCYTTATALTNARLVQATWTCSRTIRSQKVSTESVQSTKFALRNY
jgi:hypothetical protein